LAFHSVVCIKQVPDTTQVRIDPETGSLVRKGIPSVINPFDLFAVEAALRLRDEHGGTVTALCMGPPQAEEALRKVLGYGVDRAVLVTDRAFAGADTLATTYTLAAAIRKIAGARNDQKAAGNEGGEAGPRDAAGEPVDLVFCGKQSIDGDTGQVGPGLARRLGFSQLTYVCSLLQIDPEKRKLRAWRQREDGRELLEADLPVAVTITEACNRIRYASLPDLLAAADKKIDTWCADDLDAERGRLGLKGSPTRVNRIFAPPVRQRGETIGEPGTEPAAVAALLFDRLSERGMKPGAARA
jgi:electron transfer flavoprotein beta subunit